ncbi:cysteine peptidase family C39 domain-containing protein [Neptuniibacter sp. CAU 1671]|uniref:cysteine peptidase family C39 domain-containing protein n=1 Tax=Neptuniibacter sp. CAU 1671 TaxID=3032593 RepID=UPI0023DC2905|nr:cysteine peptidase family C39 domain-containing protein [Neptuniibacter sp. CAU 1671]MDF2180640.1 cysteine peptidase family C39 domain-containing protein [Neptuniibacter sp. CAU 1671]
MQRDTGLHALITVLRFHKLPTELQQLQNQFGVPSLPFGVTEILRAAKKLGLKARQTTLTFKRLNNSSLPASGIDKQGEFFIIARVSHSAAGAHKVLIVRQGEQPSSVSADDFAEMWKGDVILITPREGLVGQLKDFDIRWFIPLLVKYRKLFGEVILISFFLQLFALVTPLFFQVVMDKVLVHRGFTTLDLLAFGFVAIAVFDAILGGLRHYILRCIRYIEQNPVKARMVESPSMYLWPSYQERYRGECNLLSPLPDINLSGVAYAEYICSAAPADEEVMIRDSLARNQLTGDRKFIDEIERITGKRIEKRGQERPRNEK